MKICANYMVKFSNASSLFTNFLGIFLSKENILIRLYVRLPGAPSISACCAECVYVCACDRWGPGVSGMGY